MENTLLMEYHKTLHSHWVVNHQYSFADQPLHQTNSPEVIYIDHCNEWPFAANELIPPGLKWFAQQQSGPAHRWATTYLCFEQPPGLHFVYLGRSTKSRVQEHEMEHEEHLLPLPWLYYRILFNTLTRRLQSVSIVMSATQITSFDDEVVIPPLYNLYVDNWQTRKDPTLATCHGKVCLPDDSEDYHVPQSYGQFINDILTFVWSGFNYDLTEPLSQYARQGPKLLRERLHEMMTTERIQLLTESHEIHKEVFTALTQFTLDEMCAIPTRQWEKPMTFGRWLRPTLSNAAYADVALDFYSLLRQNYQEAPSLLLEDCLLCKKD